MNNPFLPPPSRFRFSIAAVLFVLCLTVVGAPRAHAAGFGDYVAAPFQSVATTFETVFAKLIALVEPHQVVIVSPAPVTSWYAVGKSQAAATFNAAAVAEAQLARQIAPQPIANSSSKPAPLDVHVAALGVVLGTSTTDGVVTHAELAAAINEATNALRSLIYQNESAPNSVMGTGGFTNEIAASNKIDQLSGTALNNVTVNGVSGLTAAEIPTDVVAANYLPLSGGTVSGDLNVGGNFTAGSISFGAASSSNSITTNATSTNFAITGTPGSLLSTNSGGSVIQTTVGSGLSFSGGVLSTSFGTTTANTWTAQNTFAGLFATNASTTNATSTNFFATTASSTNLFSSLANFGAAIANSISASFANFTGLVATNSTTTNATSTKLYAASAVIPSLIATNATTSALAVTGTSYFAGNVGVGTTSPYSLLSVAGQIAGQNFVATSMTATSTFAGPLAISGPISTPNPVDVYDNFLGSPVTSLDGRHPVVGQYTWGTSGAGYLETYVGGGILGTGADNTYFIIRTSQTPFEIYASFMATSTAPFGVISVVKDSPNHGFSVMWHTTFSSGSIVSSYWNDTWNGSASTVGAVAPAYSYGVNSCPTLLQNSTYVEHLVLNPPYSDADIETPSGTVLCSERSYDPLLSTLIGPYVYIQSGAPSNTVYTSFTVNDRPSTTNLNYGRFASGIDGTPIGMLAPAPGNFSSLVVGSTTPVGVFTVGWDGTPSAAPAFNSMGTGALTIASLVPGYGATLTLKNGGGAASTITMDGSYAMDFAGLDGATFLTKPAYATPYFASGLGIGTTSPFATLSVALGATMPGFVVGMQGSTTPALYVGSANQNGLVGIGASTNQAATTSVLVVGNASIASGKTIAYFTNAGGTAYLSNLGLNVTSDIREKKNVEPLSSVLADVLQLQPVTYNFNSELDGTPVHTGFIAQQVQPIFPDLINTDSQGMLSLNYGGLTPYLVSAMQEIVSISGVFEQNLIAWLGSAGNGIHDMYATIFHGQQLCLTSSSGTQTCINQQQLAALLSGQSSSVQISQSTTPVISTSTPPTVNIQGDNPAVIQVGASYADLGATITGPPADLNLGIKTFVNGLFASNILLDTSTAATDTIDYVVTDGQGLTSTSTRTVIIEAANDNTASTTTGF